MKAIAHQNRRVPAGEILASPSPQRTRGSRKENVDPAGGIQMENVNSLYRSPSLAATRPLVSKNRSPLPPRPPAHKPVVNNPLKRKLEVVPADEGPPSMISVNSDTGVQVVVRMRPLSGDDEEGEQIVQKISPNSISVVDQFFSFDSVADTVAKQQDIFELVGLPLVENCLAGFNSSIFAYGPTGSGKTYTMWGPLNAFSGDDIVSDERGLTPRVFERLFARIEEEQIKHSERQLTYQCHCSFLEIYNEQITDLLDPSQRNLQIREDVNAGVYVEYLTEEPVCTTKEVMKLLIKGLANRRTGATSINAESSRSHCVFTCVVESRSKSVADGLNSLRISRINLVDLAGSERQKSTGAAGERLKEAGNINRSLSHLGNLIYILAEISQTGRKRHIPYRDSKLTFLLQESLGGNAKLAMICAISPSQSCMNETIITLKFAQRAKAIKNKAVVNEIRQDDVKVLREQIRQLKDELLRMKSNATAMESNGSFSTGWNARRSLNLLRMSLHSPTTLPEVKEDSDEEMEIDENDVEQPYSQGNNSCVDDKLPVQIGNSDAHKSNSSSITTGAIGDKLSRSSSSSGCSIHHTSEVVVSVEEQAKSVEMQLTCLKADKESETCSEMVDSVGNKLVPNNSTVNADVGKFVLQETNLINEMSLQKALVGIKSAEENDFTAVLPVCPAHNTSESQVSTAPSTCLSIIPCQEALVLRSPTGSLSPRVENSSRKSPRTSSLTSASRKDMLEHDTSTASQVQICKRSCMPNELLAASLQRGLQIIDIGMRSPTSRQSPFRFSVKPGDLKALVPVQKRDVGIQKDTLESDVLEYAGAYTCNICKCKASLIKDKDANEEILQLVPVDSSSLSEKQRNQVPKAVEKVLAGAIRREMALEDLCAKQTAEIAQLNRLVQQYKHERECNAIIEQTREEKIARLESLMDGVLPTEDFIEEEFTSLGNEYKILKEKYENHPDVLYANIELRRVHDELDGYKNFCDLGERDVLIEEIQDLRRQLQSYVDSSMSTRRLGPMLRLPHSTDAISSRPSSIPELKKDNICEKLEEERRQWTEAESQWISLCEELRIELETCRSLADKQKMELDSEKKCREELKEALEIAMLGHARILEQYADLEEKHINLLGRHRQIKDGISDLKRAVTRASMKSAESRLNDALAAEIAAMKTEREKERRYWRDENKGLKTQLRDTAEAVQAAGELLVRLKEAEEAAAAAQKRASVAEQETEKAYQEIDDMKKNYDREILLLNQLLADSRLPKDVLLPTSTNVHVEKCEVRETQKWNEEFQPFFQGGENEYSSDSDQPPSWFLGYDRCNI